MLRNTLRTIKATQTAKNFTQIRTYAKANTEAFLQAAAAKKSFLDQAQVTERVLKVLRSYEGVKVAQEKVTETSSLGSIGVDFIDSKKVYTLLENEFAISIPENYKQTWTKVASIVQYVAGNPMAK